MQTNDNEWYYSELLDLLKQKEKRKDESYYRPIELELPCEPPIGDEIIDSEKPIDRGVVVIDL